MNWRNYNRRIYVCATGSAAVATEARRPAPSTWTDYKYFEHVIYGGLLHAAGCVIMTSHCLLVVFAVVTIYVTGEPMLLTAAAAVAVADKTNS